MDYIENNFETADRVKYYWKKYGNHFLTVLAIIIVVIICAQYWNKNKIKLRDNASVIYENMLGSIATHKTTEAQAFADQLQHDYSGTPYASMSELLQAQQAVAANQLPQAITKLRWVLEHTHSASLKTIAQIRLARVLIASQEPHEALLLLTPVKSPQFDAEINTVRGDAYLATNEAKQAKMAYNAALQAAAPTSALYTYLQMKINSI